MYLIPELGLILPFSHQLGEQMEIGKLRRVTKREREEKAEKERKKREKEREERETVWTVKGKNEHKRST